MTRSERTQPARALLDRIQAELAPYDDDNRLVPRIAAGTAPRAVFAAIAAEELRITDSDWRSVHTLAARADELHARAFFSALAPGEQQAHQLLDGLVAAAGPDTGAERPRPGCQAYPAFMAWLALNGAAAAVIVALYSNLAAFGRYCEAVAAGMRSHYGFGDAACAFFDFYTADVPEIEKKALTAVQAGLDSGRLDPEEARTFARLFQSYELMFWNTLADEFAG
ncbi:transcriptional regulator [Nocardia amamiensis]|uniref:Transcriptional regulator n=1 Tax=Nocardia amamiensis TaxID=404578 RepID=A0ABS0CUE8_9NOCA|nr:transcriptional regulator [Nocardia amamiensis]MBF6299432.1 transcriptional regulator [Nocardia amamiensis]